MRDLGVVSSGGRRGGRKRSFSGRGVEVVRNGRVGGISQVLDDRHTI